MIISENRFPLFGIMLYRPMRAVVTARPDGGIMGVSARADAHLLSGLPERLSTALFRMARPVKLASDASLFIEGDDGDGCYRVERGLLKVSVISPSGGERILAILGPGALVGELSIIDGRPRSASVTAIRDTELSFISKHEFDAFTTRHPDTFVHVTALLAARLRDTNEAVAAASFLPLKGRVARALLDLAEAFGENVGGGRRLIRQKISQSDVAAMAGIARENASRILNEWIRAGILSRVSGYYCVEDFARLEAEAKP